MKKKIAIMISFLMVLTFALAACGGGGSSEDLSGSKYLGTWVAASMSLGDETGEIGEDEVFTLTLNEDGTGTLESTEADGNKDVSNITWSLTDDGFKTKGDAKMTFTDDGDGIKSSVLGVELHFVRPDAAKDAGEEVVDLIDGKAYGYGGDDPVEAACYEYMVETVAKSYDATDVSIPCVSIINVDYTPENEILAAGDFWVYNYNIDGDTLKCVSGGNYPGVMHVSKDDYKVTAFDVVADGGAFEESAKELFGDNYDAFMAAYSDSDANEENRKITVSDYVNFNNLDVKYYQDEGWDPVELYHAAQ
ncbi:MAG: hypothetical protein IJG48_01405 [Mogibacterium sp.]|nr:hypothetical protein [Mogibacterium sp.]